MPELPEVETIANGLRIGDEHTPAILGQQVSRVHLLWQRTLAEPSAEEFTERAVGQFIQAISRRGKFLLLQLTADTLIFHLRMSGDLRVERVTESIAPHDRLILDFETGWRLAFNDTRKFGRAWLVSDASQITNSLGPEPFDPALGPEDFHRQLQKHRRQIKPLLLDQTFLAGLGNIYSDEALYLAHLHPLTPAHLLTAKQASHLLESIRQVLQAGIRHHGASIDWVYRGGDFQNYFYVYRRTQQPCRICGTLIQRIRVGQRSTHFCPNCQPAPDCLPYSEVRTPVEVNKGEKYP